MTDHPDADITLPSVVAALPASYRERALTLTIVFHPDTSRIGESAVLAAGSGETRSGETHCILGRRSPAFAGRPLEEQHVSRRALELSRCGEGLRLRRLPGASRARVAGRELLEDDLLLSREQLLAGVPLLLSHSVVLSLRLAEVPAAAPRTCPPGDLLLGSSARMDRLREQIAQLAGTDLDVRLRGETGTGKELVATAIHRASRRADAPLVSVNMAAIPTELAAAALFGAARGSYTGAARASEGYFRRAEGGTLFLDEIGDAPQEIQPQLLRALQQREVQCVGGPLRRVDLRVISATDAALEGDGCDFKAALRHRLAASEIRLPPLREHPEDIGELLLFFMDQALAAAGRSALLPGPGSTPAEIAAWAELFYSFLGYRWPGNVRELANFASQATVASETRLQVPEHIASALREQPDQPAQPPPAPAPAGQAAAVPCGTIHDISDEAFDRACEEQRYEVARVARVLGVSRQAVYRRIELSPRHRLAGEVPEAELRRVLAQHAGDVEAAAGQLRISASALRARLRNSVPSGAGGV